MPATRSEVLNRYLRDAIAAENGFEAQFRRFSLEGDDAEVQSCFAAAADASLQHSELLSARLSATGEEPSEEKNFVAELLAVAPKAAQLNHSPEERIVQNLIMTFSLL